MRFKTDLLRVFRDFFLQTFLTISKQYIGSPVPVLIYFLRNNSSHNVKPGLFKLDLSLNK